VEHSGDGDRSARRGPEGAEARKRRLSVQRDRPDVSRARAGANGPKHHYMFELYALDTVVDVQPAADAFETRANVMKAIQGHILAKAVYGGRFRRPQ